MKYSVLILELLICSFALYACDSENVFQKSFLNETVNDEYVNYMIQNMKSTKVVSNFDLSDNANYSLEIPQNSVAASVNAKIVIDDVKEGIGALKVDYSFSAKSISPEPEYVSVKQIWTDFRSDLSFCPLGIRLWIKGNRNNIGIFRFVLIQDSKMAPGMQKENQYFQYINKHVINYDGWQQVLIPYQSFIKYKGDADVSLDLSRVMGYRIDIINEENKSGKSEILIDGVEQVTSYSVPMTRGKFSSIFVQLMENDTKLTVADWMDYMRQYKEVGIDTFIIQYSVGYGGQNSISWYKNSSVNWNGIQTTYDLIDRIIEAAEKVGFKIVLGLNGGEYDRNRLADDSMYDVLYERNKIVINDLKQCFADKQSFVGWYITEEFHDAKTDNGAWLVEDARIALARYLEKVASYAKQQLEKEVIIAPALWRGAPADLCAEWFGLLLQEIPSVDIMYLQDCAGRGGWVDVTVDLPNYYSYIKKACDEVGIDFGVDIETFFFSDYPPIPYRAKKWVDIQEQLEVASLYTNTITNFSWTTFRPGMDSFEGYKLYSLGK